MTDEEKQLVRRALSPLTNNVEEGLPAPKAPGQDALARRAAAAKRLEDRRLNKALGKENC
jgi:hypothetical protein